MHILLTLLALFTVFRARRPLLALLALIWPFGWLSALMAIGWVLGVERIPAGHVAVVEKVWSLAGDPIGDRRVALNGETGFQPEVLEEGFHIGLWPWQYRVHELALLTVAPGRVGFVYALESATLAGVRSESFASWTAGASGRAITGTDGPARAGASAPRGADARRRGGRVGDDAPRCVACDHFQDARRFLAPANGRPGAGGPQQAVLRAGEYAINLALFAVLTEDGVHCLPGEDEQRLAGARRWHEELTRRHAFRAEGPRLAAVVRPRRSRGDESWEGFEREAGGECGPAVRAWSRRSSDSGRAYAVRRDVRLERRSVWSATLHRAAASAYPTSRPSSNPTSRLAETPAPPGPRALVPNTRRRPIRCRRDRSAWGDPRRAA